MGGGGEREEGGGGGGVCRGGGGVVECGGGGKGGGERGLWQWYFCVGRDGGVVVEGGRWSASARSARCIAGVLLLSATSFPCEGEPPTR